MEESLVSEILSLLWLTAQELGRSLPLPFETPYSYVKRQRSLGKKTYYNTVRRLEKRGVVLVSNRQGKRFVKLTKKGQLEVLLSKAHLEKPSKWDGQWRLLMFDIPESAHDKRDLLRSLLKKEGYKKFQASVFINPYPLNREAVAYLKESGLIEYIRIMRVVEIDNDKDLLKHFNL